MKQKIIIILIMTSLFSSGCMTNVKPESEDTIYKPLNTLYQYSIINSASRKQVSVVQLVEELKNHQVIFIGEFHSHQGSHKLQLDLLEALYKQNPNLVLSMEQFTRDAQTVLDGYLAGNYGENTLIEEADAWEHYKGSYRAIIEFSKEHNIPVIAANAPAMFVRCVGRKGAGVLEEIPFEKQAWSARVLDLNNENYKEKFMSFLKESGSKHGQTKEVASKRQMNTYAAQLLRDTTMAESIDLALKKYPNHQVVHLNGSFHSDGHLGTVAVLETMRPEIKTSVLSPLMVTQPKKTTVDDEQYSQGDYVYLIRMLPERYINEDKQNAAIMTLIRERMAKKCEL